ncbi:MAG: TonB-dependent receptor [Vicinamibacterales bacterium]
MHDVRPSSDWTAFPRFRIHVPQRAALALAAWLALSALAAAAPVGGQVVGPDGRPVAGATVVLSGTSAAPVTVQTGDDGRFQADLPPGSVTVRAFAAGLDAPPVRTSAGQTGLVLTLAIRAVAESLTVTAAPVETPLSLRADSVSVLTRADLDARQVLTLGDALRLIPGFALARNGGPGTVTSAFPRGGESDFTLVLVDGVRANAFGGGLDLSQVPIMDAARVEVVRGPQSALYGSDAIGGVVQIVTARRGDTMAEATAELGGRAARNAALSARTSAAGWTAAVSWTHQQDRGFTGRAPADGTVVSNDDSRLAHAGARLEWRGASGTDTGVTLQYVDTDRGAPGPYGANPAGNFGGVDRTSRSLTRRRTAGVWVVQPLGGAASRVRARADADRADFDLEFRSDFPSRGETRRDHARLQLDAALAPALAVSAGVDALRESGRSTFITASAVEVPVERRALAAFGEARWQPAARLAVTAGVRAERITRDALAADPLAFSPRPAFDADTVVAVNPKLTAAWTLAEGDARGPSTRLHASAGTGIRPPDAFEIAFTDNDGLLPERSASVDAGIAQTWRGGAVQADATLFLNRYDDLIISVGRLGAASRYRTDNVANARARGAELALAWRPTAALSARGHYTWLDTEVLAVDGVPGEAPPPFTVGDPLLRRPRHQGGLDLTWTSARATAFATAALRGRTLDVEPSFGTFGGLFDNPGFAMVAVGGAWHVHRRVSVQARLVNALGAAYEDVLGYPALGRTVYAGLRVAAGR